MGDLIVAALAEQVARVLIVVAIVAGGLTWWFMRDETPANVPVLYHCTIDDSQRQSGIPRACIIPATCEKNARRIAEDRCHWHGKTFYCVPMVKNYPDIIQMEITP